MGEKAVLLVVAGLLVIAMLAVAGEARAKGEARAYHASLEARKLAMERAAAARRARRHEAYVRGWARRWARLYGHNVGRWADDAIAVGWPECSLAMLGRVIWRESRGDPRAINRWSGCAGLLQIHPCHGLGAKALNPRENLKFGLRLWRSSGWRPWGL